MNIAAIRDAKGEQTSCVAVFVDTSRRKHAEESLRFSGERLEQQVQQRTRDLQAEGEQRKQIEVSRAEMMHALSVAQEEERGRISRELHDEIGQHITALLLGLKSLEKELPSKSSAVTTLQSLRAITENVSRDIHEVAFELRPTALDDLGLVRALSTYLEEWVARSHIEVAFDHAGLGEARLPYYLETILYRVVCESVRNVVKHAKAKSINVILQRKAGHVIAIVEDDGIGFDVTSASTPRGTKRLGIVGMKERVALVNGEITIESEPQSGTTVLVRLPLPDNEGRE